MISFLKLVVFLGTTVLIIIIFLVKNAIHKEKRFDLGSPYPANQNTLTLPPRQVPASFKTSSVPFERCCR